MMKGQRDPRERRYSPSLRVAAEAVYGTRARPAFAPAIPLDSRSEPGLGDELHMRERHIA
ncbi:hypothetical protein [Stakelama pacifica]|nr:hypothetical protein [Stakelama pacifica]MAW99687.1 hypothetical protein [Sphingomonas sp.]